MRTVKELGHQVRSRRREAGLTADHVAQVAGVSRRLLLELEQGKRRNAGLANVLRILEVLGLHVDITPRGLPGAGARG